MVHVYSGVLGFFASLLFHLESIKLSFPLPVVRGGVCFAYFETYTWPDFNFSFFCGILTDLMDLVLCTLNLGLGGWL